MSAWLYSVAVVCEGAAQVAYLAKGSWPGFTGGFARSVVVVDDLAYVTTTGLCSLLIVVDVSDPANPVIAGSLQPERNGSSVRVVGDYAYVCTGHSVKVLDVRDPNQLFRADVWEMRYSPVSLGLENGVARHVTPGRATCVRVAGEHAYVADEFAGDADPRCQGSVRAGGSAAKYCIDGIDVL